MRPFACVDCALDTGSASEKVAGKLKLSGENRSAGSMSGAILMIVVVAVVAVVVNEQNRARNLMVLMSGSHQRTHKILQPLNRSYRGASLIPSPVSVFVN